jgi:hypothetical protein
MEGVRALDKRRRLAAGISLLEPPLAVTTILCPSGSSTANPLSGRGSLCLPHPEPASATAADITNPINRRHVMWSLRAQNNRRHLREQSGIGEVLDYAFAVERRYRKVPDSWTDPLMPAPAADQKRKLGSKCPITRFRQVLPGFARRSESSTSAEWIKLIPLYTRFTAGSGVSPVTCGNPYSGQPGLFWSDMRVMATWSTAKVSKLSTTPTPSPAGLFGLRGDRRH